MKLSLTSYLRIYMSRDDLMCHNISTSLKYKIVLDGDWLVLMPKSKGCSWTHNDDTPRICFKRTTIDELPDNFIIKNAVKVEKFYKGVGGNVHIKLPLENKQDVNERLAKETNFEDGRVKVYGIQPPKNPELTHDELRQQSIQAAQQDMTQNPLSALYGGGVLPPITRPIGYAGKPNQYFGDDNAKDDFSARHWTPGKGFALACLVGAAVCAVVFAVIKWGW